jgi:nicotinate-nucleotide adenylyltransferase
MTANVRLGLLGGTLDPIHVGHVETALAARRGLGLDAVHVLPSNVPPHRPQQPVASGYHRFAMAALAVNGIQGLVANDMELGAPGPSYTSDTLTRFQQSTGLGSTQLFFITGADAFAEIETWHRFPEVLDLAHFVVVSRPRFPVERLREVLPGLASRMMSVTANREPRAWLAEAATGAEADDSPSIFLVDAPTPDVSSTDIRKRLASGESITDLVPAGVERHIVQHGLYTASRAFLHGRSLA